MTTIKIISGANYNRFNSFVNHYEYAKTKNYDYEFKINKCFGESPLFKLKSILCELRKNKSDYLFWIDDDAFFCNFEKNIIVYDHR